MELSLVERLRSEYAYATGALRVLRRVTPIARATQRTFPDLLDDLAERHGSRLALHDRNERLTYEDLRGRADRYAAWAREQGIAKGDAVALLMHNRPEYLAIWMGLIRAGAVVALVNTNLTGLSLIHSLAIVGARHLIVGADLAPAVDAVLAGLDPRPRIWVWGGSHAGHPRIDEAVAALAGARLAPGDRPALTIDDPALYIYTSGTTGLPKAAVINHYRVQAIMAGFAALCGSRADDRIYVTLPAYHTSGGLIGPGIALMSGGSCFMRERFSVRHFWEDVTAEDCTMFQYIGELCRYLVNAPPHPHERNHRIRLCTGNGLRPDIWTRFRDRFAIPRIVEWYAATEGNVQLFNLDGVPGAIGRIPVWLRRRFQTRLIRIDPGTGTPLRGPDGWCIECAPGEAGEAIGRITRDPKAPGQRFDGYADRTESERKILRDAFAPGDAWFRTGDLMRTNRSGHFFFIDRIGDTFRWKGENVATSEVEEVLTGVAGVREATVYGVEIEGYDGRAGMAALAVDETFDLAALHRHVAAELPAYARPLFLRLMTEIDVTGTFKHRKSELRAEGFTPAATGDPIYLNDPRTNSFRPLDADTCARLRAGEIAL